MEHYGFLLKTIRLKNKLSIKQASKKIRKSSGWISEIENNRGNSKLDKIEFQKLVGLYDGWQYKPQFGIWVTQHLKQKNPENISTEGALLCYFRKRKNMSQMEAAQALNISSSYLSKIEKGVKLPRADLVEKMQTLYGHSKNNYRKYMHNNEKSKSIPAIYKLNIILKNLDEEKITKIYDFASNFIQKGEKEC